MTDTPLLTPDDRPPPRRAAPKRDTRRAVQPPWKRLSVRLGAAALAVAVVVGAPVWAVKSGWAARTVDRARSGLVATSAEMGLKVGEIYVEGRDHTPKDRLLGALMVRRGDAILAVDLAAAKQRLDALPWVKTAVVQRRLPDTITLKVVERDAIAVWQHHNTFSLIDREGREIPSDGEALAVLPQVVGDDAPAHADALLRVLATEPELAKRVKAMVRVGGRRWNLKIDRMDGGIDVRLPEENVAEAWKTLAKLDREQSLLERRVGMIDLRQSDRLVLRPAGAPDDLPAKADNKTETDKAGGGKSAALGRAA